MPSFIFRRREHLSNTIDTFAATGTSESLDTDFLLQLLLTLLLGYVVGRWRPLLS
jgi:hypothetical protein